MNNKVSVIIPNFNREELIVKAVNSVTNQSYQNIEIVIIDDNSTDNSKEIIVDLANSNDNVKYVLLDKNHGANYCRNLGVQISSGNLIAFLDSDDIFMTDKIEKQVEVFKNKKVEIVFTNFYVDENISKKYQESKYIGLQDVIFRNNLGGFSIVMMKKEIFINCGGLDESLPSCQDWDLYVRVLRKSNGYYLNLPLANYYLQNDSISKNQEKVLKGHNLVFNKIKNINTEKKIVSDAKLFMEQSHLLGDVYRQFLDTKNAKKCYVRSLKVQFSIIIFLKLLSVLLGKTASKYITSTWLKFTNLKYKKNLTGKQQFDYEGN